MTLKVEDITILDQSIKAMYSNPIYNTYLTKVDKKSAILLDQKRIYDNCNNEYEKYFLQQFASFGISIYKANDNLDSWTKLLLSPTDPLLPNAITTVNTIPCN